MRAESFLVGVFCVMSLQQLLAQQAASSPARSSFQSRSWPKCLRDRAGRSWRLEGLRTRPSRERGLAPGDAEDIHQVRSCA